MPRTMWVILAVLLVTVVAPCARADTVTFTCTGDNNVENPAPPPFQGPCVEATPIAPDVTFPNPTLEISWYTAGNPSPIDITLPITSDTPANYTWLASNSSFFVFTATGSPVASAAADTTLPADAPLPNGTTGLSEFGTLTFAPGSGSVAVPEPGTSALMLLGIGLVLMMRKRLARGVQQAS
jgi:hypothetical protein